jgi:hypothetical protein
MVEWDWQIEDRGNAPKEETRFTRHVSTSHVRVQGSDFSPVSPIQIGKSHGLRNMQMQPVFF